MGDPKDVLQASLVNIITTAGDEVCNELPKLIEKKTPELFNKVIEIVTTKREKYREQIMKDFKEGIISKLLGDKSIEHMLREILIEGTRKVYEIKRFSNNQQSGGHRHSINKSKKRKINTKKYRKSLKKI